MPAIYLGLGSNLGNRCGNLQKALDLLGGGSGLRDFELSKIYETSPVGFLEQEPFLNCVVKANTSLLPREVLAMCQSIEQQMRRVKTVRFGPRNIDIDLLFYNARVIKDPGVTVPHPRAHLRLFVLKPMCDLAPDFEHPLLQKSMAQLLAEFDNADQLAEEFRC